MQRENQWPKLHPWSLSVLGNSTLLCRVTKTSVNFEHLVNTLGRRALSFCDKAEVAGQGALFSLGARYTYYISEKVRPSGLQYSIDGGSKLQGLLSSWSKSI